MSEGMADLAHGHLALDTFQDPGEKILSAGRRFLKTGDRGIGSGAVAFFANRPDTLDLVAFDLLIDAEDRDRLSLI